MHIRCLPQFFLQILGSQKGLSVVGELTWASIRQRDKIFFFICSVVCALIFLLFNINFGSLLLWSILFFCIIAHYLIKKKMLSVVLLHISYINHSILTYLNKLSQQLEKIKNCHYIGPSSCMKQMTVFVNNFNWEWSNLNL